MFVSLVGFFPIQYVPFFPFLSRLLSNFILNCFYKFFSPSIFSLILYVFFLVHSFLLYYFRSFKTQIINYLLKNEVGRDSVSLETEDRSPGIQFNHRVNNPRTVYKGRITLWLVFRSQLSGVERSLESRGTLTSHRWGLRVMILVHQDTMSDSSYNLDYQK